MRSPTCFNKHDKSNNTGYTATVTFTAHETMRSRMQIVICYVLLTFHYSKIHSFDLCHHHETLLVGLFCEFLFYLVQWSMIDRISI